MSNTQVKSLRESARRWRERKEAQERERRTKQELVNRCGDAVKELNQAVYAMRRSLESPPTAAELEQHYRKVVSLLAEAQALIREANLLRKLEEVDDAGTLAHYRQQRDDPEETQLAYAHARLIIEADPADRQRLRELVQDAVEEPGLRRTWDWVSNLLYGLTGQQKLVWQSERERPNSPSSLISEAKGSPESGVSQQSERQTFASAEERYYLAGTEAPMAAATSSPIIREGKGGGASGRPEGAGRAGGAQGAGIAKRKRKGGRRPLEQSHPLRFQVYERIRQAHRPGNEYVGTVRRLKNDKDFMEQVEEAGEKLDTKLVRRALALFGQRPRDQARKQQETDPA
jgi:hypothetical protein